MTFTNEDFSIFLNYCRNLDNYHKKARISYDNLANISKSSNQDNSPLINQQDYFMFNFDNLCFNANLRDNGRPKGSLPASCDALDFQEGTLFFIEFKNLPLNSVDYKKELKNIINSIDVDETTFFLLNKIYERFEDEIVCQLKNKTTESLFFSLPLVYQDYCSKCGLEFDQNYNDFLLWLLNSQKRFLIVFADSNTSPSNSHLSFEAKLKDKLNHLNNVYKVKALILTKTDFENRFLKYFYEN